MVFKVKVAKVIVFKVRVAKVLLDVFLMNNNIKVEMNLPSSFNKGTLKCVGGTNSILFFGFSIYPLL